MLVIKTRHFFNWRSIYPNEDLCLTLSNNTKTVVVWNKDIDISANQDIWMDHVEFLISNKNIGFAENYQLNCHVKITFVVWPGGCSQREPRFRICYWVASLLDFCSRINYGFFIVLSNMTSEIRYHLLCANGKKSTIGSHFFNLLN